MAAGGRRPIFDGVLRLVPFSIDCERGIAALMAKGIGAFVDALDPAVRAASGAPHHGSRFGMSALGKPPEAFADLNEANIPTAGLLGGTGHLDRELGEILNAMAANQMEGAQ